MGSSTLYTIGTVAPNHVAGNGRSRSSPARGRSLAHRCRGAVDGFGVVLASNGDQHAVVRMEAVSAVKIAEGIIHRNEIPAGAHPMPGPRPPGACD